MKISSPPGTLSPFQQNPLPKPLVQGKSVVVVGLGYVGLPLALIARARGYAVVGVDIDARRRTAINNAEVADLEEYFLDSLRKDALAMSDTFEAVETADIIIVCVPTPVDDDHNPDLGPVMSAVRGIAPRLHKGQLVIIESTIHPGTCEENIIPEIEKLSGLRVGKDIGMAHCPERINPGDRYWPVHRIPRVIGATSKAALERAAQFYRSILDALVYEMGTIREAEAVKIVENSFRDINIAFVNELAMSFSMLGIDVVNVIEGAATKPFAFMPHFPGCGVGGHCIPVDPYYLIRYAKQNGFSHEFLSLARSINEKMPAFAITLLAAELHKKKVPLKGATVALLGLSYKANVGDLRESPSFEILKELEEHGVDVRTFDPHAPERSSAATLEEALHGSDAAIVATAHAEFVTLSPRYMREQGVSIVIDGRNCLSKEDYLAAGMAYRGIGR